MRKFLLILALVIGPLFLAARLGSPQNPPDPEAQQHFSNIIQFDKQWDRFIRDLSGCKSGVPMLPENCTPSIGSYNYKAFLAARREAKKLFDLRDPIIE